MISDHDNAAAEANGPQAINAAEAAGISPPPMPAMFGGRSRLMPATPAESPAAPAELAELGPAKATPLAELPVPAVPAAVAAVLAATPVAAPSAPVARIIGARTKRFPLAWPVEFGAAVYSAVTIMRPSTAQVEEYYRLIRELPDGAKSPRFPVFYDDAGAPIPEAVLDALDDDDGLPIFGAVSDFLPTRLRLLVADSPEPSSPQSGDDTELKSSSS